MHRRQWLHGLAATALTPWAAGCRPARRPLAGGWVGSDPARGHRLRSDNQSPAATGTPRRATVAIVGGGIAGLAAARALQQGGVDDYHLFELEDQAGGNSRAHRLRGLDCPLGAHYLPLPGPQAHEVAELLESLGVSRQHLGRTVYDERYLCHSPQERLFLDGRWHDGLLPLSDAPRDTLEQIERFAKHVDQARRDAGFAIPTPRAPWNAQLQALDDETFAHWLDRHGLVAPGLRWYLDYCCRDEYGAGPAQVSAWAGLHYFGSRPGFQAPGTPGDDDADRVLTWPQGNAWLVERLLARHRDRVATGQVVRTVQLQRHGVSLWVEPADGGAAPQHWEVQHVIVAVPLHVAARIVHPAPDALREAARQLAHAPWLVSNLWLDRAPLDRFGPAPAWDNVIHASPALGYVDASHQLLAPAPGPRVFTHYWALGAGDATTMRAARQRLLDLPWTAWAEAVLDDLAVAHPDIRERVQQVDLARHGHAMSIPAPGVRSSRWLAALQQPQGRLHLAHADLSAYSVFEEAYHWGLQAGRDVVHALRG